MSKKKSFNGSTMSLKDFHGGSIPSDLQLPSAPGSIVRQSERPSSWGSPVGRLDHRFRTVSASLLHNYDEKASFLSHHSQFGRNFDEDERKPINGISGPRRIIDDDTLPAAHCPPSGVKSGMGKASLTPPSGPALVQASNSSPSLAVNLSSSGTPPNAWAARKEATGTCDVVSSSAVNGSNTVSKLAQASAVEKIQSGRWQSKPVIFNLPNETIRYFDSKQEICFRDDVGDSGCQPCNKNYHDYTRTVGHASALHELVLYEHENSPNCSINELHSPQFENKFAPGYHPQHSLQAHEDVGKPQLKLSPRLMPLDNSELQVPDSKQGYISTDDIDRVEAFNRIHISSHFARDGSSETTGDNRPAERPKLNLKPRSHPLEHADENTGRERSTLFGGARPREVVLKERGVDESVINNIDKSQRQVNRTEIKAEASAPLSNRYGRSETSFSDSNHRAAERRDHMTESEKLDAQRNSWCSERRPAKEDEKQHDLNFSELENWRKHPEFISMPQPKLSGRYIRTPSALELAQAFSRPVVHSDAADRVSNQMQVPFSRLTGNGEKSMRLPSRHISGY